MTSPPRARRAQQRHRDGPESSQRLRYLGGVPELGAILTAIVTPFDDDGAVDEQALADLMRHLAVSGSDGFVVCGTTGEAAMLDDEEHLRVIEVAVQARPAGTTIVAG